MTDWIEWKGGECPVSPCQRINLQFRDGETYDETWRIDLRACQWDWMHDGKGGDIIAYRVVNNAQSSS
jgi:hypothetical protein